MLAQRWANIVSLTNLHPKTTWQAYFCPMLGKRNTFNMKHNHANHVFKTSTLCLFAKRWVIVVFSTNFYPTQGGRHTLVQCWPNVMRPTQLGHVKTGHRCTLARRWINVVFSTNCHPKPKWHAYVAPMLAQRNAPNAI